MKKIWAFVFILYSQISLAGVCEKIFDGDAAYSIVKNKPSTFTLNLNVNDSPVANISRQQIIAFKLAKDRIQKVVGLNPKFIICSESEPNAFAVETKEGTIVGVTAGMLRILDGDENMTAAVVGHEIAHHTSNHRFQSQRNQLIVNILATIIGIYVEDRVQRDHGIVGIGQNLAVISSALTLSKFSRDQEREADEKGLRYMVTAGYKPDGAVRLAELLSNKGLGGSGLFYDTHPSWSERLERLRVLTNSYPNANTLAELSPTDNQSQIPSKDQDSEKSKIDALFALKDPEKLFNESYQLYLQDKKNEAIKLLIRSAELGNGFAQANLCEFYFTGNIVKQDVNEALKYCKASSSQGNPIGQFNLGYMYFKGAGVRQDSSEGMRLYRMAVDQNLGWATSALAQVYQRGMYGVNKDPDQALKLFLRAAELADPNAYGELGVMYSQGITVTKNLPTAIEYLKKGVNFGNSTAALQLGMLYISGDGVIKDEDEGIRLLKFASDKNHVGAQYNLGVIYDSKGDTSNSILYYKLAAKNGLPQAKVFLDQRRIPY